MFERRTKNTRTKNVYVYNGMTQVIVVLVLLGPICEWSLKSAADASQIHKRVQRRSMNFYTFSKLIEVSGFFYHP